MSRDDLSQVYKHPSFEGLEFLQCPYSKRVMKIVCRISLHISMQNDPKFKGGRLAG